MKKYVQITVILTVFFLLVWLRNGQNESDIQPIVANTPQATPTSSPDIPSETTTTSLPGASPNPTPTPTTPSPQPSGKYKNGTYTGSVVDAYYGNMQVQAVIQNGKLTDVIFLQYPNDNHTSQRINTEAMPILKSQALTAQSAQVDGVSGASSSSPAFVQSLNSALQKAL